MTVKKLRREGAVVGVAGHSERACVRNIVCTVAAATLIVLLSTACQESQSPRSLESSPNPGPEGSFDVPVRKVTIDLGASPYYPDLEDGPPTALSCYYFSDFVVKEHYLGGRGAEWLSIVRDQGETPDCSSAHEPGERIIEYPEWEGYFAGAKDRLVFLDGSDTVNGGLPFVVYDALTGEKIFEDSAYYDSASSSSHVLVASTSAGYTLNYLRVADAGCNLNAERTACWNRIKAEHSLRSDDMPDCTGYDRIAALVGTDRVDSVIAYAVEVTLFPLPSVRSVAGSVRCWPTH